MLDEDKVLESVYREASAMLRDMKSEAKLNDEQLEEYFSAKRYESIAAVYWGAVASIINRNMMPRVIGDLDQYDALFMDFEPRKVLEKYGKDSELLVDGLKRLKNLSDSQVGKRSLWRMFANGAISSAAFMAEFNSAKEFYDFADTFANSKIDLVVYALPTLLAQEIDGFGFALACDFLKEAGYAQYPKPDEHIIDVLQGTGCLPDRCQYTAFKKIRRMAEIVKETPYKVDKTIWLICSGKFYDHNIEIKGRKDELINRVVRRKK